MGGLWFRWSALDRTSKWLAGSSLVASGLAAIPAGRLAYQSGYGIGRRVGSGAGQLVVPNAPIDAWAAWWMLGCAALSGLLWWAMSRRQDEMFNRVQNWALGMSSCWAMTSLVIWSVLASAGSVAPVSIPAILLFYVVAFMGFWFVAIKRWA